MKHHYIVIAIMRHDEVCPMGAICAEEELSGVLRSRGVKRYKLKILDDELIPEWDKADWQPV